VDDPALMAEPLAHPGAVIRRSRGTAAEQIAALPKSKKHAPPAEHAPQPAPAKPARTAHRPSRDKVNAVKKPHETSSIA
jgi:hypothetical protein